VRLAEALIGLFKIDMIRRRGPLPTVEHVEAATLRWVDWFNEHRLLEVMESRGKPGRFDRIPDHAGL
jgi:hypothetical protein